MIAAARVLDLLLTAMTIVIIVRSVMSFFPIDQRNGLVRTLDRLADPLLTPIRCVLKPWMGMDFSGLVAIVVIMAMRDVVSRTIGA